VLGEEFLISICLLLGKEKKTKHQANARSVREHWHDNKRPVNEVFYQSRHLDSSNFVMYRVPWRRRPLLGW
jgi:hypothetical protein